MKMKKTVFLIRNVAPFEYGGGETYQLMLAVNLKRHMVEVYIITASNKLLGEAKKRGIKTIRSPYIKRQNWSGWRNILFFVYCYKIFKQRRWYKQIFDRYSPDVINVQSRDDWIAATIVAKKKGIKVLWTDHMDFRSWVLVNVNNRFKNWIGKWILRCAKNVDVIVMISDYERKCFEKMVRPRVFSNIKTIKNGVEDKYEEYKTTKSKKNSICYIGRIVDYKGIGDLITAFDEVNHIYVNMKLNIYGDGEDFERFKVLAKNNRNIKFYGRTDEPLKKMAENEIFVLPSYREGLSLSLLDAAMMSRKIIASNIDGNPEVIVNRKTGLLVSAGNVQQIKTALVWMIEHTKNAQLLAKNVRKKYEIEFDFEKIFEKKMLPLYNLKKEEEK